MGRRRIDLTGQRFERLLVLKYSHSAGGSVWWTCLCDCGAQTLATGSMLRDGRHKSCGCLKRERIVARSTKHGHKTRAGTTRTYNSWMNMVRRCTNPDHPRYPDWGGRGITVDPRWLDFANFLADMGERPEGVSLDRRDNNGPYAAWNCTWSTPRKQAVNSRNFKLTPDVVAEIRRLADTGMTVTAIGKQVGLDRHTVAKALPL